MPALRRRRLASLAILAALVLLVPPAALAAPGPQTLEGRLLAAHGDDFATGRSLRDDRLVTASGEVRLAFLGERPAGFLNGAKVRVTGTRSGGVLAVGRNREDAEVQQPAAAAATGTKNLAVLLVNFTTLQTEPWTTTQARGIVFDNANSVAAYFAEESYGGLTVAGDVFGYYTIDSNTAACDYLDIGSKARAAATSAGVNLSGYSQIQYVFPTLSSCGWAGLAYLPGRDSWINGSFNLRVSSHELSHSYGVHHASTISCTQGGVRVSLTANQSGCSVSEYGDPFTVMGSASTRHTHNQQLATLGWITGSGLQTITTGGTYAFGAAEDAAATPRAVRVPRGNGTYLYLELRQPFGQHFDAFSASDPAVNGVSLRISNDWTTVVQSKLIDATPATTTFSDAPLAVGATFTDPDGGFSVTTVSIADRVATVQVSWGPDAPTPDTTAPTAPTNLRVASLTKSKATLAWNAASDNVGVTGYHVYRNGTHVATTTSLTWSDSRRKKATTYVVRAVDAAGNLGPASNSATVAGR